MGVVVGSHINPFPQVHLSFVVLLSVALSSPSFLTFPCQTL